MRQARDGPAVVRWGMTNRWARSVLVLAVMGGAVARVAVADDDENAAQRQHLIDDIDHKVESISSELSGFASDSDASDIDDAVSYARDVLDLVSQLAPIASGDSHAEHIVSNYPGYVQQFRETAVNLKREKQIQRLADGLADRCVSAESDLQTEIRRYVGDLDSSTSDEGPAKLTELGQKLGRTWGDQMQKARDNDNDMKSAASNVRFSVSEDRWSYVTSYVSAASSGMVDYWNDKLRAAADKCQRLEQGEKHPDIVKALETLSSYGGNTKATVTQLKKDYNAWMRDVRKLRSFSDQDRDAIRNAFCTAGEYEMEDRVNEVADRWANDINSVYGTITGQGDRLKARATTTAMAKYKGPKDVIAGVDKNLASLANLKGYELAGSANPAIRTRIEWGKKRHSDLEGACSSYEKDVKYCRNTIRPTSGCRLDCVKDCKVIEFKPDNDKAKAEGAEQVRMYSEGLNEWYKAKKDELFEAFPELAKCENSDKTGLALATDVVTYEMCSGTVKNSLGQQLDEATLDLAETPE